MISSFPRGEFVGIRLVIILLASLPLVARGEAPTLTVDTEHPGVRISPTLYGLMTEEINHAYDGGLYGELIQNRIFRDAPPPPPQRRRPTGSPPPVIPMTTQPVEPPAQPLHWSLLITGGLQGAMTVDTDNQVNTVALTHSLRLDVKAGETNGRVGVANEGFWGIPVKPNTEYHASFFARASNDFTGPINVSIENNDTSAVAASASVDKITGDWKRYEVTLKTGAVTPSANNKFVLSTSSAGSVWFNLVSLFPPTYHDRPNGSRIDIMELLAGMKPAFLRFPGGNYLEGDYFNERFNWKETIGPLDQRPGHQGPWRYRSSDGLGLLEFLGWCEDLKMQPVLAVFAGYTLRGQHVAAGPELQPYVDEALEEIEYVTGGSDTKWGAQRAKDGHPAPFDLTYVEIGNEDNFDRRDGGTYDGRYTQFYDAIKAKYPKLQLIATARVKTRKPDVMDDHYYRPGAVMARDAHHYDHTDRNGPKIFVGEWASREGGRDRTLTPSLHSALGDAAWMTGLERNSDLVLISCYAPLFTNVNEGAWQWATDLIGYDAIDSFGSPSYYVQAMFAQNRGDVVLPVTLTGATDPTATGVMETPSLPTTMPTTGDNKKPIESLFSTASRDEATGDIIVKFVNMRGSPQQVHLTLQGASTITGATGSVVTGKPTDVNNLDEPTKVSTKPLTIQASAPDFTQEFPAYSASVLRFKTR